MKRALILLLTMAALLCTAVAQSDFGMDPYKDSVGYDKWDSNNYMGDKEKGYADFDRDQGKSEMKCFDRCYEKCFFFSKCLQCGHEHGCDLICDTCGEKCKMYKFCPSCCMKYASDKPTPTCDYCGKECIWQEVCPKCGYGHRSDASCDKCGGKCQIDKCCYTHCDRYCYVSTECKENCPSCREIGKKCGEMKAERSYPPAESMMGHAHSEM